MTITEIARLAGVSVSTASKILNNKDDSISAKTRERVLAIAREYGYRPYGSTALGQNHSGLLGVLVQSRFGTMVERIISRASELGYSTVFRYGGEATGPDSTKKGLASLLNMNVDGLILDGLDSSDILIEAVEKKKVPYVLTKPNKKDPLAPAIDYEAMGYALTHALVSKGHSSIACMLREGARTIGFFEGYRRCLFECGAPFDEELVFMAEQGTPRAKIASHAFSGIVASHYSDAITLYETANELRYEIPYDLSIASLSSDANVSALPSIAHIRIPGESYGSCLVDYIVSLVERRDRPDAFVTDTSVRQIDAIGIPYASSIKRAVVVGSINVDNYYAFDKLPKPGSAAISSDSQTFPGGKCLNEAIGIAKLSLPVIAIGRVGGDADADYLFKSLSDHKVDTTGIRCTHDCKTGQGIVFVPHDGDSTVVVMPGANKSLSSQDIQDAERLFSNASYCLVNTEIPIEAAHAALECAKAHGATTVMKPSGVDCLPDSTLSLVDIIVPNQQELREVAPGLPSIEACARSLLERGAGCVIATLASKGCEIYRADARIRIPAIKVDVIDSTGAGDAFIAALTSYLMFGHNIETAARVATYAAGISVTKLGASAALTERSTLEAFIRKNEPNLL